MRSARVAVVLSIGAICLAPTGAGAYEPPGATMRVSPLVDVDGKPIPDFSAELSGDGRVVAIVTEAPLVAEDDNGHADVYVGSLRGDDFELATVSDDERVSNGHTWWVRLSYDGRFVAFMSEATNLVGSDSNGATEDAYVRDRLLGTTRRVSVSTSGVQGSAAAYYPDISDDGRYVSFHSSSANLVPGDSNGGGDVFVRDLVANTTELVTLRADGSQTDFATDFDAVISGDGRYVAFATADPMVPQDTNFPSRDIYVHDRVTGVNDLVSVSSDGSQGPTAAFYPAINRDGRFVAFSSFNANYVPNDTNGASESFVHDRQTGRTERISVTGTGGQGNGVSGVPSISGDGRYVMLGTLATNMGWQDDNADSDVYRYDRLTRTTELASVATDGTSTGNQWSYQAAISADGRFVAFFSAATDLTPPGTGGPGAYVRDFGPPVGIGHGSARRETDSIHTEGWARFGGGPMLETSDGIGDGRAAAGADLTGARIFYRPEREDLRVQIDLAPYAHPYPPLVGTDVPKPGAGLTYTLELLTGATRVQIRAVDGPDGDRFTVHRCAPACTEVGEAVGGIGTESDRVLLSAPLAALGLQEGDAISGGTVSVTMTAGEASVTFDHAVLPAAAVPRAAVTLGLAEEGTAPEGIAFDHQAALDSGRFSATLPSGEGAVWARTCLGDDCDVRRVPAA